MRPERREFLARFGGIYEHSPWVAEQVFDAGGAALDRAALIEQFKAVVDAASDAQKIALIRAHPDLAGRAAIAGELTPDSAGEQASAGLDACTADEFRRLKELNARYRDKFGFPFVMAVRNSSRHDILAAFAARIENDAHIEFGQALAEIHKIATLRFEAL